MKKNAYHVNPVVNKWEEDQRRARMEKMIQRAKSTLPPEARGASKPSGPKKPSPYAAENATKPPRKQNSSSGREGQPSTPVVNVQELDSLIYNRVQEILGMPLMRRVAANRATAGKAGTPPKPPQPGKPGRRPAWNNDWCAETGSAGSTPEDKRGVKTVGGEGRTHKVLDRSPSKPVSTPGGSVRSQPTGFGTPKRTVAPRIGAVSPVDLAAVGSNHVAGNAQRRMINTTHMQGAGERVVLLSSPTARSTAGGAGASLRPASGRYTASGGEGSDTAPLEQSVMSAIRVLNPHSTAALEATARNEQRPLGQSASMGMTSPQPGSGAFGSAGRGGRHIPTGQSLVAHSRAAQGVGGSSSGGSGADGPRRASMAHPAGITAGPAPSRHPHPQHAPHEDEDVYADDDFEEYDGSDEDGGAARRGVAEGGEEGDATCQIDAVPDVAMLRSSVNALNALVQMKIQELARCPQPPAPSHPPLATSCQARSSASGEPQAEVASASPPKDMLASLALAGLDDADAGCDVEARRELGDSGVMDGLRQSDLDYLARLGGGDLADAAGEVGNSTDERLFVLEPGAPTGSARAWGDRQPWQRDDGAATGLHLLRARQEKEKEGQVQELGQGGHRLSGNGAGWDSQGKVTQAVRPEEELKGRTTAAGADEDDSVLLGETLSPRQRTGTALQMQAVGSALAALASSGQLNADDAQELKTQTTALFGSLVQLHNLMKGPRAAELYASPGNTVRAAAAGGFTPTNLSPDESPSQSLRRRAHDGDANTEPTSSNGSGHRGSVPLPINLQAAELVRKNDAAMAAGALDAGGVPGQSGHGSHIQLTPKHRLVAEDVAWMAGLMQSLSKSFKVDNLEP